MADRYEISSDRWAIIEAIVSPPQRMGRPRRDDRQMLNGIFWILCSGAKWRDLPERFGPWKTFTSASGNGVVTARSSRLCATFIFVCEKTVSSIWTPGWSIPRQSGPPGQPTALEKKGPAGTVTPLSRPKPGRTDYQNTPRLRQPWLPAGHHTVAWRTC
ncbi:ISPS1a [Pseudomonas syringae pv. philadelphi]|nr:ISPS1a [Pseudomonas syringae pv. philadelphi]RMM15019.1 ISPS1a [Pseudomonas syringae pv. berberidis]